MAYLMLEKFMKDSSTNYLSLATTNDYIQRKDLVSTE